MFIYSPESLVPTVLHSRRSSLAVFYKTKMASLRTVPQTAASTLTEAFVPNVDGA